MKESLEENKIALGTALGSMMQKEDSSSEEKWKISIPSSPTFVGFFVNKEI